jgi:tetratricopeptide (TPR) repeat protein
MPARFLLLPFAIATIALLAGAPNTANDAERVAAETERAIERACLRADAAALEDAVKSLDAALAAEPNQPALLYSRAFACYASGVLHRGPHDQAARQQCYDAAVSLLQRVKGAPWEAEAAALHGNILGELINLQKNAIWAGATLGPKSSRLLAQAIKAAPTSPRVLMFSGRSLLFTPKMFGGDPVEGAALLRRAVDRFATGGTDTPGPRWGHADALAWLGVAHRQSGDLAAARVAWEQALSIEPDYAWVKRVLLPSLGPTPSKQ